MKKSRRYRFTLSSDTKSLLAALLLLASLFSVAMILPYYLATAIDSPSPTVVSSEDVGQLQSAHFIERFIHSETEIETEKGIFLVRGTFVARKGHPLVLERREDGARVLCDPADEVCARLVK